jgi:hypothetical protein
MSAFGLFDSFGVLGDPRALSEQELANMASRDFWRAQQATLNTGLASLNYFRPAEKPLVEKPLDERFADFKIRLSAAQAKRAKP